MGMSIKECLILGKSLDILTKVNSEDLILYHNYLNDIFRSMLYDESRWNGTSRINY